MTFRKSAPAIIVAAIAVVILATAALSTRFLTGFVSGVEAAQFNLMRSIVETTLRDTENKALARAELIADLPAVKALFASRDREGLMKELGVAFINQKNRHGVDQAQFHLPDNTSFLRLHDPKKFGDDLTATRPMVVALNRDKVPLKSVAIARNGPGIFGGTPITGPDGNHIGSFEIGLDFAPMMGNLKSAYNMDAGLFIDEKLLRDFAKGVDPERLGDQYRFGKYIRFEATNADLLSAVADPQDLAVVTEPVTYVREVEGVPYGVVLTPLANAAGTQLGVIATTTDFSGTRATANQTVIWQLSLAVLAALVLTAFVVVVIRGLVIRPLGVISESYAKVAAGEELGEIEGAERFPAEFSPLIHFYERIRARRTAQLKERAK